MCAMTHSYVCHDSFICVHHRRDSMIRACGIHANFSHDIHVALHPRPPETTEISTRDSVHSIAWAYMYIYTLMSEHTPRIHAQNTYTDNDAHTQQPIHPSYIYICIYTLMSTRDSVHIQYGGTIHPYSCVVGNYYVYPYTHTCTYTQT